MLEKKVISPYVADAKNRVDVREVRERLEVGGYFTYLTILNILKDQFNITPEDDLLFALEVADRMMYFAYIRFAGGVNKLQLVQHTELTQMVEVKRTEGEFKGGGASHIVPRSIVAAQYPEAEGWRVVSEFEEFEIPNLYHEAAERGYWTDSEFLRRDFELRDETTLSQVVPIGIEAIGSSLAMVLKSGNGEIKVPIDNFPGLKVIRGDSTVSEFEEDGELLIEITYLKGDTLEQKPRRIRPTGIKIGIMGDTEQVSAEKQSSHRAMGERVDYYLEGIDTQYAPGESGTDGLRSFPFRRLGVWGDVEEIKNKFVI